MTLTCLVCGKTDIKVSFEKSGINYYECRDCSFRFSMPSKNPNFKQTIDEYEPAYQSYLAEQPSDLPNFKAALRWMELFHPLSDANAAHLDVGAGSGKFIDYIRSKRPCKSMGIEPSRALFDAFCLADKGIECKVFEDFAQSTELRFNVITAFDVLEHLPDPCGFFEGARKLLTDGGYLFISTPDVGALVPKVMGKQWYHYNAYHLAYLNRQTMAKLAQKHGFEIVEFSHKSKRISLKYLFNYGKEFLFRIKSVAPTHGSENASTIPMNLFDIMYVVLKRTN